jgi:hypothetical protein
MLFVKLTERFFGISLLLNVILLFLADNIVMAGAIEELYFPSFRLAIIVDNC